MESWRVGHDWTTKHDSVLSLLHQSTCYGKELAKKLLIFSRSGISSPHLQWIPLQSFLEFKLSLSQHFCCVIPTDPSQSVFLEFFSSFLFIHSFVYWTSNQWAFIEVIFGRLDLYLGYKLITPIVKSCRGGIVWSRVDNEQLCIHSLHWLEPKWKLTRGSLFKLIICNEDSLTQH